MSVNLRHAPLTVLEVLEQLFPRPVATDVPSDETPSSDEPPPYEAWPLPSELPIEHGSDKAFADTAIDIDLRQPYTAPPISPFDLFAITAQLLELSGAYHHVVPSFPIAAGSSRPRRLIQLTRDELSECARLAKVWRRPFPNGNDESQLRVRARKLRPMLVLWDTLIGRYGNAAVLQLDTDPDGGKEESPGWWRIALKLMIIADDTAEGVGFELVHHSIVEDRLWFMDKLEAQLDTTAGKPARKTVFADGTEPDAAATVEVTTGTRGASDDEVGIAVAGGASESAYSDPNKTPFDEWWTSLSGARQEVVCVLPKARTAAVGCTLRSLSHHLALLPPRGIASAKWVPAYRGVERSPLPASSQFNVLLVPFPFTVTAEEFAVSIDPGPIDDGWGTFIVRQTWRHGYGGPFRRVHIIQMLADFVASLAREAVRKHGADRIDAIVFPELALDAKLYRGLLHELPKRLPSLRLLVSGLSINDHGRHGNYVAVSSLHQPGIAFGTVREKHHRWKLDRAQIEAYGLQGRLDPRRGWWEDIDLLKRRIDFSVFHQRSVLAAMICEDLARVDPCQEILRSVGPNLVIALLMDAPQLPTRWPARYATVLAEDPGSSVLTLTSRGLMTHQWLMALENDVKPPPKIDPVIALWRDSDSGIAQPITCPYEAHGVWLKLWGRPTLDQTIDGRRDSSAVGWTLAQHRPLSIPEVDRRFGILLGDEDLRLRRRLLADASANNPHDHP